MAKSVAKATGTDTPAKRRCTMTFTSGKPCTWVPVVGYPCCANHVVKYVESETGLSAEEVVALILGAADPELV